MPPGVPLIADAAHSLGGTLRGKPVGSLADITILSFHAAKQITTGEGGGCLTNDDALAARMRHLRNHGMTSTAAERERGDWRYDCTDVGFNYRMTDFAAALGASQLERLSGITSRRSELAARYDEMLASIPGLQVPPRPPDRKSAWHLYVVSVGEEFGAPADTMIDALRAEGILATRHFPLVPSLQHFRRHGYTESSVPMAASIVPTLVTLPLFPGMSEQDQDDVVLAIQRLQSWFESLKVGTAT
jgi:perosamine synthetase